MSRLDKLKIIVVISYMLNPLGILAFASSPPKTTSNWSQALARHQFQAPPGGNKVTFMAASNARQKAQSSRMPASIGSEKPKANCMR